MVGLITTRHLLTEARTLVAEFGVSVYLRCLRAALLERRPVTFLEVVMAS